MLITFRLVGMLALTVAIVRDGDENVKMKEARSLLGYRKVRFQTTCFINHFEIQLSDSGSP